MESEELEQGQAFVGSSFSEHALAGRLRAPGVSHRRLHGSLRSRFLRAHPRLRLYGPLPPTPLQNCHPFIVSDYKVTKISADSLSSSARNGEEGGGKEGGREKEDNAGIHVQIVIEMPQVMMSFEPLTDNWLYHYRPELATADDFTRCLQT